jgi:hypothetical protein
LCSRRREHSRSPANRPKVKAAYARRLRVLSVSWESGALSGVVMQQEDNTPLPLPLTFGGVAAFGCAGRGRLLVWQAAVALLAALALGCFFEWAWVPAIERLIQALPDRGAIRNGVLAWSAPAPVQVSSGSFLAIAVDPNEALEPSEGQDLQVTFGKVGVRFRSWFGYTELPYPTGFLVALNRPELEAWWGAWHPAITAGLAGGTFLGLFGIWGALAFLYAWPVKLIGFYADREMSLLGAWRLSAAALLPGALFFTLAIVAYTFQQLHLLQLLSAAVLHLVIGWIYLLVSPFFVPAPVRKDRRNPFAS